MGNPQTPPAPSFPVSPILAKWPIGQLDQDTGKVYPDLQFLKAYQELWAALQGSGGTIDLVSLLIAMAETPPFEYSSPAVQALVARIASLQVPQDAPRHAYTPFLPADPTPRPIPFTPAITFATPGDLTVAYSAQEGEYQVLGGGAVLFNARAAFTPTFTTASGALQISAPAVACAQLTASVLCADPGNVTWPAGATAVTASIAASTQYLTINGIGSGIASAALGAAHYTTGTAYTVQVSGCYFRT